MSSAEFLSVLSAYVVLAWVIQGAGLHLLTSKLAFRGAGVWKSINVMLLLIAVGFGVKLVFLFILALFPHSSDSVVLGFLSFFVSFVASVSVVHFRYQERFPRSALVVAVLAVIAMVATTTIKASYAQAFRIPTSAMAPAIEIGDYVFALKSAYRTSEPERGDIVVFEFPGDREIEYVKRVMGLPGETVEFRDRVLFIDGGIAEDPWGVHVSEGGPPSRSSKLDNFGPIVVPEGEYFFLGDNRNKSSDSRYFGCVSEELLVAKVMLRYWPVSRLGPVH